MSENLLESSICWSVGRSSDRVHRSGAARFKSETMYLTSNCELATYLLMYNALPVVVQGDCEPFDAVRIADELCIRRTRTRR